MGQRWYRLARAQRRRNSAVHRGWILAHGKSNKEIGANLFISETTVKGHLHNIFTKLNVLSRTEAVTVASHRGLVQL
jgi:DNA-binding NarL/FixJ family response regulator